jgi:hypothetical protein
MINLVKLKRHNDLAASLNFSTPEWKVNGQAYPGCDPRQLMLEDWLNGGANCTTLASAWQHLKIIRAGYVNAIDRREIVIE